MKGSKFFAETIKAYGVSHLFFVPTIMIPAMAEMEEDCHHRRARTRRHFGPARWSSLNRPLKIDPLRRLFGMGFPGILGRQVCVAEQTRALFYR